MVVVMVVMVDMIVMLMVIAVVNATLVVIVVIVVMAARFKVVLEQSAPRAAFCVFLHQFVWSYHFWSIVTSCLRLSLLMFCNLNA